MKRAFSIAGALLVVIQAGCALNKEAPANPDSQEFPPPPEDVMAIRTYWGAEKPACPVAGAKEVSARTENGLRWAAWNLRAQAVVSVRARILDSMPTSARAGGRVYEGVAVRYAEGCAPPAADAPRATD
jgi:hypothetical protein